MPSDGAARHTGRPEAIRNPDQLQQAKRPGAPEPRRADGGRREPGEPPRRVGILGQLDTERAHD